jgi:hypothetical protein
MLGSVLLVPVAASAQDPHAILRERERRHRIDSDEHVSELVITAKNGRERRREWISYRQGWGQHANRLIRFTAPADVRGVAYLLRQRPDRPPDEWLYLPSMNRERRVVAGDRETAFAGTDFAYEDLEEFDQADYASATLLPDRDVDGQASFVIEVVPRRRSAYSKKVLVIRKSDLCLLAVEYFRRVDRGMSKRLTLSNYQQVQGHWMAMSVEMQDLVKGSRTAVYLREVALNRPQPADRYTIQNLVRGGIGELARPAGVALRSLIGATPHRQSPAPIDAVAFDITGSLSTTTSVYSTVTSAHDPRAEQWTTLIVNATGRLGAIRLRAQARAEHATSDKLGPARFDPADRALRRSPISLRELSATIPIASGIDLRLGRTPLAGGLSDGYSPFDAFMPRDATDPFIEERLPVWAAVLSGERRGIRAELVIAPLTTPWRLPRMDGRHSPLSYAGVFLIDAPAAVPSRGFQSLRVAGAIAAWDLAGWARAGVRPAPILEPLGHLAELRTDGVFVPIERRYPTERAAGLELSRAVGNWIVRTELAASASDDADLGKAVIWTVGGSTLVRNGSFTGTIAINLIEPPVTPLILLDRAILPAVVLAMRQRENWGRWEIAWLGTYGTTGGALRVETARTLSDRVDAVISAELPHGTVRSPARAFAGSQRLRAGLTWSW